MNPQAAATKAVEAARRIGAVMSGYETGLKQAAMQAFAGIARLQPNHEGTTCPS
jgi:hypothetical protein